MTALVLLFIGSAFGFVAGALVGTIVARRDAEKALDELRREYRMVKRRDPY